MNRIVSFKLVWFVRGENWLHSSKTMDKIKTDLDSFICYSDERLEQNE